MCKMNPLIEKLFASRGITPEAWKKYNDPSHDLLTNIDDMCEHLKGIRDRGEELVILPDFDMDGIMSGTVGYGGLSLLGFNVDLFVPDPKDGYGFGPDQIDRLVGEFPCADAIITCDTGIGCRAGAKHAKRLGLDVLITDHHQERVASSGESESSPRGIADVIVNPCAYDETYKHAAICGAHVFWQVLDRFAELYESPETRKQMHFLRVFAGIGTISDTMPVLWENRQLVKDSIEICKKIWGTSPDFLTAIKGAPKGYSDTFRGIYAAMNMFAGAGKLKDPSDVDETFFGYYLAPAFNAVKRMDGDMARAFDVFLGKSPSLSIEYLLDLNERRKTIVEEALAAIDSQENPYAPICYVTDAMPGILGLLAMRLSQRNGLPCIVVNKHGNGKLTGSGRSPEWYPAAEMSPQFSSCFAGHAGAFGCKFENESQFERFFEFTCENSKKVYDELDAAGLLQESYDIMISDTSDESDAGYDCDLLLDFVRELEHYRPFGRGFEEPQILVEFNAADAKWAVIGKDKSHLKITVPAMRNGKDATFDILCWGQASLIENKPEGIVRALGSLSINDFRGNLSPQFTGDLLID